MSFAGQSHRVLGNAAFPRKAAPTRGGHHSHEDLLQCNHRDSLPGQRVEAAQRAHPAAGKAQVPTEAGITQCSGLPLASVHLPSNGPSRVQVSIRKRAFQCCTLAMMQCRVKACYAGYPVLCQAKHGLHSPDARQGHQDRAHQDPADRHRGQGNTCIVTHPPAPAPLFAVLSLQSRHGALRCKSPMMHALPVTVAGPCSIRGALAWDLQGKVHEGG